MVAGGNAQISFSFMELRELLKSFEGLKDGSPTEPRRESAIYHLVDHLGELAIPVLMRKLVASPESTRWAGLLLLRLAQDPAHSDRICADLREQLQLTQLPDLHKLAIADLLANLGGYQDDLPALAMPQETAELSLVDLAGCIETAPEVARAVHILLGDLPPLELVEFIEDMAAHQPAAAKRLATELLLRDDLDQRTHDSVRQIQVSMDPEANTTITSEARSAPKRSGLRLARHGSGDTALVCYARMPDTPARYRALSLTIGVRQGLVDCQYLCSVSRGEVDRQLLGPLAEAGYEIGPVAPGAAKQHAILAMRSRSRKGLVMPQDYYLGRDLFGLHDEHRVSRPGQDDHDAALLARGTELLRRNQLNAAREILMRYAQRRPDDSEAMSTLGDCLRRQGEVEQASAHLARAAWLAPRVGRHHWNRASLAHQQGRLGDCFLALQEYLGCVDAVDEKQRSLAEAFIADYSRRRALQSVPLARPVNHRSDSRWN